MQQVCDTLSAMWSLPVLCDCKTEDDQVCLQTCMSDIVTAMGFTIHVREQHPALVYTQPSSLTAQWGLKYTVTLHSPIAQAHKHVSSIIVGAVLNVPPFIQS